MCSDITSLPQIPFNSIRNRKYSFPAAFHSNVLGSRNLNDINANSTINYQLANKRRFSNVSDAVTRKLSTTIGWRNSTVPTQEIVTDGKTLCGLYIRSRLRRSRCFTKKFSLQRLRSIAILPEGIILREVFPDLLRIGVELERMHPKLYTDVTKQVNGGRSRGIIISEKTIRHILLSVSHSLFQNNITWGKIISMYALAGGLAVDCIRQDHADCIPFIIQAMGEIVEDELVTWINDNGGWQVALQSYCRPSTIQPPITKVYVYMAAAILSIIVLVLLLKWFGKLAFIQMK